jgi:hypothetical protein
MKLHEAVLELSVYATPAQTVISMPYVDLLLCATAIKREIDLDICFDAVRGEFKLYGVTLKALARPEVEPI